MPKHPNITVPMVGEDGNAFAILGRVQKAMRSAGIEDEWQAFQEEATSSTYDNLLATVTAWFDVN